MRYLPFFIILVGCSSPTQHFENSIDRAYANLKKDFPDYDFSDYRYNVNETTSTITPFQAYIIFDLTDREYRQYRCTIYYAYQKGQWILKDSEQEFLTGAAKGAVTSMLDKSNILQKMVLDGSKDFQQHYAFN